MYDSDTYVTAPPPPPPAPPPPGTPARYAYLVGRLKGRQITMEEATELFELQQQMLLRARVASSRPAPGGAPPPPPPAPGAAKSSPAAPGLALTVGEDTLWESLPILVAAAGLGAALIKRFQESTPPPGSRPPAPRRPA